MNRVCRLLDEAALSVYPGAVACVLSSGELSLHYAAGLRSLSPQRTPNTVDTIYDLASLTKPMAIGSLLMCALADRKLTLDDVVSGQITVRHLAGHTSGLPAWLDFGAIGACTRADIKENILDLARHATVGESAVYSDLGYILLGFWLEDQLGQPLDVLFDSIRSRVGLKSTSYNPITNDLIAPTEGETGLVHDPNAKLVGGVAGHAGLFGTALEVAQWGQSLLDAHRDKTLPVAEFWRSQSAFVLSQTTWRLCFDSVTPGRSSAGKYFGAQAIGHLGFTGTSVWIDPEHDVIAVLLTNRVHPNGDKQSAIKAFRPQFHDAVMTALGKT